MSEETEDTPPLWFKVIAVVVIAAAAGTGVWTIWDFGRFCGARQEEENQKLYETRKATGWYVACHDTLLWVSPFETKAECPDARQRGHFSEHELRCECQRSGVRDHEDRSDEAVPPGWEIR